MLVLIAQNLIIWGCVMDSREDRNHLIGSAIGVAVVTLIADGKVINRDSIVDELERQKRVTGNVIGKSANRDAADLVRKGQ